MSSATTTTMDAVLTQLIRGVNYNEVTYENRALFGMLPKFEGFKGKNMPVPLKYGQPQGVAATFSNAQSQRVGSKFDDFVVTRRKLYGIATIDGETADVSEGEEASFVSALKSEIDGVLDSVAEQLETHLFRGGTGLMGVISSGSNVSSKTITLASVDDIVNLEVGQTLRTSETDGGAHRTGSEVLAGIDRNTADLTATSTTWDTVCTAIATGDHIYVSGNLNVVPHGLQSWLPATVTATLFFGVDRTVDAIRLGGNRYDASSTGETIEEAIIEAQGMTSREGGTPDVCFMNNRDFRKLIKATGSRVQYPRTSRPAQGARGPIADIAFRGVQMEGDYGPLDVVPASKCPQGTAFLLQMDTWEFATVGKAPKILMRDGLRIMRQQTEDGYEVRVGLYGNLICKAPGYNCRVTLPV